MLGDVRLGIPAVNKVKIGHTARRCTSIHIPGRGRIRSASTKEGGNEVDDTRLFCGEQGDVKVTLTMVWTRQSLGDVKRVWNQNNTTTLPRPLRNNKLVALCS